MKMGREREGRKKEKKKDKGSEGEEWKRKRGIDKIRK